MPDYSIPNAAWSGHHLILADEDLVDNKIRRPLMSPSLASGYNSCPASVVISRLQPWDDDPFAANSLGTVAHAVMETVMGLPPDERTIERALDVLKRQADEQWSIAKLAKQNDAHMRANAENRQLWLSTLTPWIEATFLAIDPPSIEVETTEYLLDNIEIGKGIGGQSGIPLKGYVDLTEWVIRDGRRVRLIDDWKYGKPKVKVNPRYADDYGDQQRIYFAGYTESTGEAPAGARLIFPRGLVGLETDVRAMPQRQRQRLAIRDIDVSPNEMRKTLLGFRAGWNTMNESCDRRSFEARPSGLCGWCPAANSCPVAKLPNQKAVDAAAKQPSALQLGIPTIRPGATLQEVRDAPGVTIPLNREPDFETPIEPVGDDLFPLTLIEAETEDQPAAVPPAPAPAPAEVPAPPVDDPYLYDQVPPPEEPPHPYPDELSYLDEPFIPDEAVPALPDTAPLIEKAVQALVSADDPFGAEWLRTVHVQGEGHSTTQGATNTMSEHQPEQSVHIKPEAVPYEAEINGTLNLNSYSAMAVCGLVAQAFEHMQAHNVRVGTASLNRFSQVLAGIVLRVQKRTTGFQSFQSGANTRLRGFLHMALEAFPAPFRILSADGTAWVPATAEDWQAWTARIENLLTAALSTAVDLYDTAQSTMHQNPEAYFAAGGEGAPVPVAAAVATA